MPDLSGPFAAAAFLQGPWYRDRGYMEPSGVQGAPQSSVAAGDLGWSSSGLTSSLALGRAHVRGAYYERTATAWTYTHPANTNTNPRIDRIVLRRDLTLGTPVVAPAVLQGTPAASPTALPLTQVEDGIWEVGLQQVTVPPNSGTVLAAVDERRWVSPDGTLDSGWINTAAPGGVLGVGSGGSKYRVRAGWCALRSNFSVTPTTAIPNGQGFITLPPEARPTFAIAGPLAIAYGGTAAGQAFETVIDTGGLLTINGRGLTADGYQISASWPVG